MKGVDFMLSEDANEKSINFAVRVAKVSGKEIIRAIEKFLASRGKKQKTNKQPNEKIKAGRTTLKQLQQKNDGLSTMPLNTPDLRLLNGIMKKHRIQFAAVKDGKNRYTLFFKARDDASFSHAIQQYANRHLRLNRAGPSLRRNLTAAREQANNLNNNRNAERNRNRGGLER